jgi:ribosomal protein L37AE/L43A
MARFVVVEIPDNEEADAFVEAIQNGYVLFSKPHPKLEDEVSVNKPSSEWKVTQVYAVPTMFCECLDKKEWSAKSVKYGWWVCAKCSKPKAGALQHPYNLLEKDVDPKERVYYMGFRADRRGWRIPEKLP